MSASLEISSSPWIYSKRFDSLFISGGAFFTLLIAAVSFQFPHWLPFFFWIWVIAFEGSHFWATFSRTYFDTEYRKRNKGILVGSLVFFIFPFCAVIADFFDPTVSYMTLYGFFIFVWSLYHNARQHYGFTSIYSAKAGLTEQQKSSTVQALYFSIIVAQVYFLINFKLTGTFGLMDAFNENPSFQWLISRLPIALTVYAIYLVAKSAWSLWQDKREKAIPIINYLITCLIFYPTMFYLIAPIDLFVQGQDGAQKLMLIAIMNSLFHNIQYHAIVWYYSQKRYNQSNHRERFGLSMRLNGTTGRYLAFSLIMGSIFGFIVWHVGDWPDLFGSFENVSAYHWAYVLFFGIIGHHFYLDQKIWRPSKQTELRSYLKLEQNPKNV